MYIGSIKLENDVFLGPMAGVTDLPFRKICMNFDCGMMVTEMVSAKALHYGDEKTNKILRLDEKEISSIQIFGSEPEIMAEAAYNINGFSNVAIDINMGCPAPKIVKNGEGSALMKKPDLVKKIVRAVVRESIKPVTVKIRKGWDENSVNAVEISKIIESEGASAITVHGRTRDQFYAGKADYSIIKAVKNSVEIPVVGNGDIFGVDDAVKMINETGCDGIMIARGAQGNPWLLKQVSHYMKTGEILENPLIAEVVETALKHFKYLIDIKGEHIAILEMRKHGAWYLKGRKGSSKFKEKINKSKSVEEVKKIFNEIIYSYE
jgi:tRNA-dihydrouridine synthase B